MSYYDGGVLKAHKIHDGGPDSERFNLAIFSEGYRYDQLGQFVLDANVLVDRLFTTHPFDQLRCSINVYRLDVWSLDSGADDPFLPPNCPGTGALPRTFFDATFCGLGIERLIVVDSGLVEWVRWHHLPQAHEITMLVNASKEGGNGDTHGVVSKGGGWDWPKVILHELGHSAFGLGDEYDFLYACEDDPLALRAPVSGSGLRRVVRAHLPVQVADLPLRPGRPHARQWSRGRVCQKEAPVPAAAMWVGKCRPLHRSGLVLVRAHFEGPPPPTRSRSAWSPARCSPSR